MEVKEYKSFKGMHKELFDDLIPVSMASSRRGVTTYTIYQTIERGRLSSYIVEGRQYVRRSEIENFEPQAPGPKKKNKKNKKDE